jgi:hypothetical protein
MTPRVVLVLCAASLACASAPPACVGELSQRAGSVGSLRDCLTGEVFELEFRSTGDSEAFFARAREVAAVRGAAFGEPIIVAVEGDRLPRSTSVLAVRAWSGMHRGTCDDAPPAD